MEKISNPPWTLASLDHCSSAYILGIFRIFANRLNKLSNGSVYPLGSLDLLQMVKSQFWYIPATSPSIQSSEMTFVAKACQPMLVAISRTPRIYDVTSSLAGSVPFSSAPCTWIVLSEPFNALNTCFRVLVWYAGNCFWQPGKLLDEYLQN